MNYDVVVIGASSAGLYAAEALVKLGKRVAVFDRAGEINPEERTYIVTPELNHVLHDISSGMVRQEIKAFLIESGQHQASIQLSSPDLIIDRAELISSLASRASAAGVAFFENSEFLGFENHQGDTKIKVRNDDSLQLIKADYLIGADGVDSSVRKSIGMDPVPSVPLLQAVIDLPAGWDPGVVKVWFDVLDTPYFYWLIPDGKDQAVVGLISERGANIQELLNGFLSQHEFKPISYQSGQAALHTRNSSTEHRVGNITVLLVGDAAGQVKVTTVGGTVTGFVGAQNAVRRILGNKSGLAITKLTKELDTHFLIRKLLNQMAPGDYGQMISMLTPTVVNFLSLHDRDNMRSHFWKLAILQPRFIPLGLKLLFKTFLRSVD